MIQHTLPPKHSAPVPSPWQPFMLDNDYRFITTIDLSPSSEYLSVTARHTSGEVCSVRKYSVGSDVSAHLAWSFLINGSLSRP